MAYIQKKTNAKGEAVYKIKPENTIVIYDDIDLEESQVKIRKKGGPRNSQRYEISGI